MPDNKKMKKINNKKKKVLNKKKILSKKMSKPLSQKIFEETTSISYSHSQPEWNEIMMKMHTTKEELLPELKGAIQGDNIRHPLVYSHATPCAYNNFLLLQKKQIVEEAEKNGDWVEFVFTHERPYRVDAIKQIQSKMDDETYWQILAEVYTDSENLRQNQGSIRQLLTAKRPQREAMMHDEEKAIVQGLPDSVTVYRGYGFTNSKGWSWTLEKEKAVWFAERFACLGGVPRVATGKVSKKDIIAYFDGREEKEIVCDPKTILEIVTERLDGKDDKPRIPREDKYEFDSYSACLGMHMKENPLMFLSELKNEIERMHEEAEVLVEHHDQKKLCSEIDSDLIDSELLKSELKSVSSSMIRDILGDIAEAFEELEEFIEDYSEETLCGDFDLK